MPAGCWIWWACRTGPRPCLASFLSANGSAVAIARALANDPQLLLADEPTGNLDSKSGATVLDLFDQLRRERELTIVMITHGSEVAARAERVVWICDGRLSDVPPTAE